MYKKIQMTLIVCVMTIISMTTFVVAEASAVTFSGQHTDSALQAQINIASNVWAARGISAQKNCINPVVGYFANDLSSTDGIVALGRGGGCELWLLATPIYSDGSPVEGGWSSYSYFASVVEHETGHALGLEHSDSDRFPIMTDGELPEAGDTQQNVTPTVIVVKKTKKINKCKKYKKAKKYKKYKKCKKHKK